MDFLTIPISFGIVRLPAVISNGMVLQQQAQVSLWGWATPCESVAVYTQWNDKTYHLVADPQGNWQIKVPTSTYGGPYKIVFEANNRLTVDDVWLGEVWLSSGQSNMEWPLRRVPDAKTVLSQAKYSKIRLFKVPKHLEQQEVSSKGGGVWQVCDSLTSSSFSAMAYYFARRLHLALDHVPIGIINASWGGTSAECWISSFDIAAQKELRPILERWNSAELYRSQDSLLYERAMESYNSKKASGETVSKPEEPYRYYVLKRPHRRPGILFNGMIYPLVPYTIKGVIWYQGTSNRAYAKEYGQVMKTLITSWRKYWSNERLPFYYLQISAYDYGDNHQAAILREQQLLTRKVPYTMIGSSLDIGDLRDIHPPHKEPYGQRLAWMALHDTYHKTEYPLTGPLYKSYRVAGNTVEIQFDHAQGLMVKGELLDDIYIAGEDKRFIPAQAFVKGDKLIVLNPSINHPVAVRYGWNATDKANLYNKYLLPACSFRTDQWDDIKINADEK